MDELVVPPGKPIKLVVWDLDDTLWRGVAPGEPTLHPAARRLIATLDERGIMQSVVRGSDAGSARRWLERLGVAEFFLYPQLGPGAKSRAVRQIASALNIALEATLLIDDDAAERDEVIAACPVVRAVAPAALDRLAGDPLMGESLAAIEPRPRRLLYVEDQARSEAERAFHGPSAEFVATLGMTLTVASAASADLHRMRELVNRTNQLGVSYRDDELERLRCSPDHACLLVSLADRFGDCGKVGIAVLAVAPARWTLKLLVFSCRVMPRGVSTIVLDALLRQARAAGVRFVAELRPTSKNQPMALAYQRAGFAPIETAGDLVVLEHALAHVADLPGGTRLELACPQLSPGYGA